MYGRSESDWEEMRDAAQRFLVSVAESQGMTDYGTLSRRVAEETGHRQFDFGLAADRAAIGQLLGEISKRTNSEHGVMLSALVTHRGSNDEGAGFYRLAAELGKMPFKPTSDQRLEAFALLTREVHCHYAKRRPTAGY